MIDELLVLQEALKTLLDKQLCSMAIKYSNDLINSLAAQPNSLGKSVRNYVIQFDFISKPESM